MTNQVNGRDFIQVTNMGALPTAAAIYEGLFWKLYDATSGRTRIYQCCKSDAAAYLWVEIVNGGL